MPNPKIVEQRRTAVKDAAGSFRRCAEALEEALEKGEISPAFAKYCEIKSQLAVNILFAIVAFTDGEYKG